MRLFESLIDKKVKDFIRDEISQRGKMKKFYVLTRGRTGSTAVMDSLNRTKSISAAQELFIKYTPKVKKATSHDLVMPRYDLWLRRGCFYERLVNHFKSEKQKIKTYLDLVERHAEDLEKKAFGFKVLAHHFDQRLGLRDELQSRGYKVIFLTRNIPRQVISGMVAKKRGKYNARQQDAYQDDISYVLDKKEFKSLVKLEQKAVQTEKDVLISRGVDFLEVRYEDFVARSEVFFKQIFDYLGIPAEPIPSSSFSIMIKDVNASVQNFADLEKCMLEMEMIIE